MIRLGNWLAFTSFAVGLINWMWIAAALFGARVSANQALMALMAAGVLVSAPVAMTLGLVAALGRDRVQFGYVGATLNLLPTCYSVGVLILLIFTYF